MYCRECGSSVNENAEICTNCGTRPLKSKNFCQGCGTKSSMNQDVCLECGTKLRSSDINYGDNPSTLLNLAVCCFPLLGVIMYFLWREEKPKTTKEICNWAIAGTILGAIFYIFSFFMGIVSSF